MSRTGIVENVLTKKGEVYSIKTLMENLIKALNLFQVNVYNKSTVEYSKVPKNIQGETSLEAFIHAIKDKLDQILL